MNILHVLDALTQAEQSEVNTIFEDFMENACKFACMSVMSKEVERLCGPFYQGHQEEFRRAGSALGKIHTGLKSESIKRPRVRKKHSNGTEEEYKLKSYEASQNGNSLRESIIRALLSGVSTRDQSKVFPKVKGISKSQVSRLWQKEGQHYIEQVRRRNLSKQNYLILMIDGIHLENSLCCIVAMGITEEGDKHMLDFEIGSSENTAVCTALTTRLVNRGVQSASNKFFAVLDGSQALRNAILAQWPDTEIQTCLVHLERKIRARLSRRHHNDIQMLFKFLRESADLERAQEAIMDIKKFIAPKSKQGLNSLEYASNEMTTFFRLGVPDTLSRSLLSTNAIENSMRNIRKLVGRVKKWKPNTDMPERWMAAAVIEIESGFRKIRGYRDLNYLKKALEKSKNRDKALTNSYSID